MRILFCKMNPLPQILSEAEYKVHEKKSLQQARTAAEDSFHCRTPGCQGWCFVNEDDNVYKCELCGKDNCLTCQVKPKTRLDNTLVCRWTIIIP